MQTNRFSKNGAKFFIYAIALLILLALPTFVLADDDDKQKIPIRRFPPDLSVVDHAYSTLEREDDEVELKIKTRDLLPNHVYTVWWVVFNDPGNTCATSPCSETDVPDSVLWATGRIAKSNGKAKFQATLEENIIPGQVNFGLGLTDAEGAEIHVAIRDHGPDNQGLLYEQLHTFGGGCNNSPPHLGGGGTYTCEIVQFAIHTPGDGDHDDEDDD